MTLPTELVRVKNKIDQAGAWITLLEISDIPGYSGTLRYCNNNEDITWDSQTWTALPFLLGTSDENLQGDLPELQVQVSNVTRAIQTILEDATDGGQGASVTLRLVNSDYLDEDAAITEYFEIIGVSCDAMWATFTLGCENFFFKPFPQHIVCYDSCRWKFKSTECGYMGAGTSCDKTLSQCIVYANESRYGAFPAIREGFFDV